MLLPMSVSGGILILLIIVLRALAINKFPKKIFVLLWIIALLRLLIPFSLPIHYGIATPATNIVNDRISNSNILHDPVTLGMTEGKTSAITYSLFSGISCITVVWLVTMVILLAAIGILYFKEYQKIRTALPISEKEERKLRSLVAIPKDLRILESDRIFTPLTFGILSPRIVLPKVLKSQTDMEWKCVLLHEMVHIKRADNLWKIILLLAVSIHWFNPFVWLMYILFNRDIELSCDEKVIAELGENKKTQYAMALVSLAEKQYHWSLFTNGFGKNPVQERIVSIMKYKKVTALSTVCAIIVLGAALTVFAQNTSKRMDNKRMPNTVEGSNANVNSIRYVVDSEYFSEYKKYGLSYDSSNNHLVYNDEVVGYFKDETTKNVYTRVLDNAGTIGLIVLRDSNNKIIGLETTELPANSSTNENTGITNHSNDPAVENSNSVSSSDEDSNVTPSDSAMENNSQVSSSDGDSNVTPSDNAMENNSQVSSSDGGSSVTPINSAETGCGYEEGDQNNNETLKAYEQNGITYHSAQKVWKYQGKEIAGLFDNGNGTIYINESAIKNSVYLQIDHNTVKEISENQFNHLLS